jgi:hypothetical protein
MADASRPPPSSPPPGWGDLLAALPLEAPPASRWRQIEAQLDDHAVARDDARADARPHAGAHGTRRTRSTRMLLATAAGLCALALLPFVWRVANRTADVAPTAIARTAPSSSADAAERMPQTSIEIASPPAPSVARVATAATVATPQPARNPRPRTAKIAASAMQAAAHGSADEDTLESLYAASAQLETLLTLTRDTRVESGPAAALAGGFDAELALIDARLAEPGLDPTEQRTLWRARVDTLQQASSFEAHQRLLSSEGRRYEGALVSVD